MSATVAPVKLVPTLSGLFGAELRSGARGAVDFTGALEVVEVPLPRKVDLRGAWFRRGRTTAGAGRVMSSSTRSEIPGSPTHGPGADWAVDAGEPLKLVGIVTAATRTSRANILAIPDYPPTNVVKCTLRDILRAEHSERPG